MSPRPSLSRLKDSCLRGLVRISSMLSSEETFSMEIFPFWTLSRRKRCQISICFVREYRMAFLLRSMAPLLSQRTGMSSRFMSKSTRSCFIHKACWQVFSAETYSASVVEIARAVCFLENHDVRYSAFGRHLEEIHVTWAHLEKKWTRLRTYTNISQEFLLSSWRRRHRLHVTPSQLILRRCHKISRREDLTLFDNESWNDLRDFAKPVKAIALPQDVPSTSDRLLIELKNQVQHLMEAHLAPTQPNQVNKITTSCEICSGLHDTQYCMEDPKQAFVEYASSRTNEAGGLVSDFVASQDARLSKPEADFKQQQSEMTNKIDTVLKVITDRVTGALPRDTVKNLKLSTTSVFLRRPEIEIKPQQLEEPEPTLEDEFPDLHLKLPVLEVLAHASIYNAILDKLGDSKPFDTLADLGSCVSYLFQSLFKAWTYFKDLLQKVPYHRIDLWLQVQVFYDHVNPVIRQTINQSFGGKIHDRNAKESWALLEDLTLFDNKSWNDLRDFAKLVKAIALPQDVPSTSDRRLIELKNQVQRLMEAHLAPTQPTQVNKITTSCEIFSGLHDT
ncbi:hypothetical protein Tco_1104368 [Tanacetum coccineum]